MFSECFHENRVLMPQGQMAHTEMRTPIGQELVSQVQLQQVGHGTTSASKLQKVGQGMTSTVQLPDGHKTRFEV